MTRTARMALLLALAACGSRETRSPQKPRPDPGTDPDPPATLALGEPSRGATAAQLEAFERGLAIGSRTFGAPEGLGPSFNATACLGCHERPAPGGSAALLRRYLLAGRSDASAPPVVQRHYSLEALREVDVPGADVRALRSPGPLFGVGQLAAVDTRVLAALADPDDADGDGVSGRPGPGRFGRKAQWASLEALLRDQLLDHLGLTSDPLPAERAALLPGGGDLRGPFTDVDEVPDPEISADELFDLLSFAALLAPPQPDPAPSLDAVEGKRIFAELKCSSCHLPELQGPEGPVAAYTDLLLHAMGPELADPFPTGDAGKGELRTQPLWGVAATGPWLHDGRAGTLDEAIHLHGGEAQAARDAYAALPGPEQAQVLAFLASLGGSAQVSPGLLAPGAPAPDPGQPGGPRFELDDFTRPRFEGGRAVFDRDFGIAAGVGSGFNSGSCRGCHFQPAIGGAGPIDVDVIRQGKLGDGGFEAPPGGTMLHRHHVGATRPEPWAGSDVFEARQTQPIFGLGLTDRIPDADILAHEDPDDEDGDGISGRAHFVAATRVGRLGWKAQLPSIPEFSRDALSNEMGITVPVNPVHGAFGTLEDDDGVVDPEVHHADMMNLDFFAVSLAPLPRVSADAAAESRGEALFAQVGCDRCHLPSYTTYDGLEVRLYSDLLLHDVAPPGYRGIADGDASPREFRTAPLWGVGRTGPWMHDGRAFTLDAAIRRHEAEGLAARDAYAALADAEREDLIAFLGSL